VLTTVYYLYCLQKTMTPRHNVALSWSVSPTEIINGITFLFCACILVWGLLLMDRCGQDSACDRGDAPIPILHIFMFEVIAFMSVSIMVTAKEVRGKRLRLQQHKQPAPQVACSQDAASHWDHLCLISVGLCTLTLLLSVPHLAALRGFYTNTTVVRVTRGAQLHSSGQCLTAITNITTTIHTDSNTTSASRHGTTLLPSPSHTSQLQHP
jgi:hypothetical protein